MQSNIFILFRKIFIDFYYVRFGGICKFGIPTFLVCCKFNAYNWVTMTGKKWKYFHGIKRVYYTLYSEYFNGKNYSWFQIIMIILQLATQNLIFCSKASVLSINYATVKRFVYKGVLRNLGVLFYQKIHFSMKNSEIKLKLRRALPKYI